VTIRARDLPKVRDRTLAHLEDPQADVRARTGAENQPSLDAAARHLRAAELYWVSPDMAALAMSAGEQLAAACWATADRPAGCGMIVFDGGVGQVDIGGGASPAWVPIQACTWGPAEGGCEVWLYNARSWFADLVAERGAELVMERVPPLMPLHSLVLPVDGPVPFADLPATAVPVMQALAASWLLMQQPQLTDRTQVRPDKSVRKAYARLGRPDPDVTVVDLRRQYVPDNQDHDAGEGRRYRHRWVVSGHWRQQPVGPERAQRRQTWIAAYVKGPDGAPLLKRERVNVWRR
jgi:hypothetical protein